MINGPVLYSAVAHGMTIAYCCLYVTWHTRQLRYTDRPICYQLHV